MITPDVLVGLIGVYVLGLATSMIAGRMVLRPIVKPLDDHLANTDDRIRALCRRIRLNDQEIMKLNEIIRTERQREEVSES